MEAGEIHKNCADANPVQDQRADVKWSWCKSEIDGASGWCREIRVQHIAGSRRFQWNHIEESYHSVHHRAGKCNFNGILYANLANYASCTNCVNCERPVNHSQCTASDAESWAHSSRYKTPQDFARLLFLLKLFNALLYRESTWWFSSAAMPMSVDSWLGACKLCKVDVRSCYVQSRHVQSHFVQIRTFI